MSGLWEDAEVLHAYTRAQAILDGVLVPVTDLVPDEPDFARSAGFRCHVALTSRLAGIVIPTELEREEELQDLKGRLWDVLMMARMYRRGIGPEGGDWFFPCIFALAGRGDYRRGRRTLRLWASLHGGDEGQPVVTIGFPGDR